MALHGKPTGNPTRDANRSARRRAREVAAKDGHRPVDTDTIWARDHGVCCICRLPVARELATLEHRVPVSRGGQHVPSNLGVAHRSCNSAKGNKTRAQLRKEAKRPGLRRKSFRRKPRSQEDRTAAAVARERREFDQTDGQRLPLVDEVPPDDVF